MPAAKFISKYAGFVLVMEPHTNEGPGHHIKFENGVYVTSDPEEIEFLRNHREFGISITEDTTLFGQELSPAEDPAGPETLPEEHHHGRKAKKES
ncbi:MAG TPA: hypothetical protein GXX19_08960 [Syntrophomonadaceae bacterium]|nr:hypothetical protein [Syntrophomonadaceae bacterium]